MLEQEKAQQLAELDAMKDQFFNNISHELRTPLTLITDPLRQHLPNNAHSSNKEDIEIAYRNSKKLLRLIDEIMDLAKLQQGDSTPRYESIDINSFLNRTYRAFESYAASKEISLHSRIDIPEDMAIHSDPKYLEKIVNNLVSNAVKFSPIQGLIQLEATITNNKLMIEVSDNGPGIPGKEQERIFERYYQAVESGNYQGGTGIGLALTKELVGKLKGQISITESSNRGTRFQVLLPAKRSELSKPDQKDQTVSTQSEEPIVYTPILIDGQKPEVLFVEDNREMRTYIAKVLHNHFRLSFAANGIEGLKAIQKENFDLIISDIMMPGLDGLELREKVMNIPMMRHVPYIFLSAKSLEEDILNGLRLGVDDYITKPFVSDELLARSYNLVQNKMNRSEEKIEGMEDHNKSEDHRFIKHLEKIILENMNDSEFKVTDLSDILAMSQRNLARRIKGITGMTSVEFVLEIRLLKAYQLIEKKIYNSLVDVRYMVGIESASYFSRKFKTRFGISPSELMID